MFQIICYVFSLRGVDIILGCSWLASLGDVKANWTDLTMEFQVHEVTVTLNGDPALARKPCRRGEFAQLEEGDQCWVLWLLNENFDVMMGVTISADRSSYVDFSAPYIESGVVVVIPSKDNESKNTWIFLKPLTISLWLIIGAFFLFTGFVVWILKHSINKEFQGPPLQQVGTMFWFSFLTLVFENRKNVISNLTRFVVIVWVLVVLVLQSSYTANLASMLTVQQLQPTDIYDVNRGENIGYQDGQFAHQVLIKWRNLGNEEATWTTKADVRGQFSDFGLEDKAVWREEAIDRRRLQIYRRGPRAVVNFE